MFQQIYIEWLKMLASCIRHVYVISVKATKISSLEVIIIEEFTVYKSKNKLNLHPDSKFLPLISRVDNSNLSIQHNIL